MGEARRDRALIGRSAQVLCARPHAHSAQLVVLERGSRVASLALGSTADGEPMSVASVVPWTGCTGLLGTAVLGRLWERGVIDPDDPVARVIPEMRSRTLTWRALLSRTRLESGDAVGSPCWEDAMAATCASPAGAGEGALSELLLAEAATRLTGWDWPNVVQREVLGPLGITDVAVGEAGTRAPTAGHETGRLAASGSVASLATLAAALQARPGRAPLIGWTTALALRSRHRVAEPDLEFGCYLSRGCGVIVDGWFFGAHCSPRTFGLVGTSTFVAADPERQLVIAAFRADPEGGERDPGWHRTLADAVYRDLKLDEMQPRSAPRILETDRDEALRPRVPAGDQTFECPGAYACEAS